MPKKKNATYLTVKPEAAMRLLSLGFAVQGTQVPANRAARMKYKHDHKLDVLPGPVMMPYRKPV